MLNISLNRDFLIQHKRAITPVKYLFKDKYQRKQYKFQECLILTQNENKLIYTTCGHNYALQNHENIDFELPYPIVLNLVSVPYSISTKQAILEIPDCTMENLRMFYDANRPKYIKDSDFQTTVVAINGKRANLEYIQPTQLVDKFDTIITQIKLNPILHWQDYQWFLRDYKGNILYQDFDMIYKTVFHTECSIFQHKLNISHPDEATILHHLNKLQSAAKCFGRLDKNVYNTDTCETDIYTIPVAMFQDAKQSVLWQGIAQKQK